jgi:protocatechuate 3,4-dioxygenase beta subunit
VVWLDQDADGMLDTEEPGLSGVTIDLFIGRELITGTTTLEDGSYEFTSLSPGTYRIREKNPPGVPYSTTPDEMIVALTRGWHLVVNFGDWNGMQFWIPMILRP